MTTEGAYEAGERLSLTTKGGAHRRFVQFVRQRGGYADVVGLGGDVRGVEFRVPMSNLTRPKEADRG